MDISWNNLAQAQVNYYSLLDSTDNLRGNGLNLKLRSANADMNYNFSRNSTFVLSEWELAVIKCFKNVLVARLEILLLASILTLTHRSM